MIDGIDGLLPFATERQRELLTSWNELGSSRKAAAEHGVTRQALQDALKRVRQLAKEHGLPDVDPARTGYSTLYRGGKDVDGEGREVVMQWVKHATPRPAGRKEEEARLRIQAFADGLKEELPKYRPGRIIQPRKPELCTYYPIGDQHFGMLSWKHETGHSWDIDISEKLFNDSTDYLLQSTPDSDTAVIVFLGDFYHYDSYRPETPAHRNLLDADGRYPKMVKVGGRSARRFIEAAARKHRNVKVIWIKGNHDESTGQLFQDFLEAYYEDEPRIDVMATPNFFSYYRFGKNLLGATHGDRTKPADLPGIMAADVPELWGQTTHRLWLTGHYHSKRVYDYPGCTVEVMRVLPPTDAWAHRAGYRQTRGMEAIVLHQEFGEVIRLSAVPEMFDTPEPEEDK